MVSSASSSESVAPRRRRRGEELEHAILDATWEQLREVGYASLTMESIAARARTGVAVLYRRWANKDELVLAALEHYRRTHPVELPDTGSLRGDLLAVLTGMGQARAGFFAVAAAAAFSGVLAGTGMTPRRVRERILGEQRLTRVRELYQRAHQRGELDVTRVPETVLMMPFDLVRHDLLLDLKPVPQERIRAIVDELFLPLVQR